MNRLFAIVVGLGLAVTALAVTALDTPPQFPGDMPRGLGPDQYFTGTPWRGNDGITESVASIMARAAGEPRPSGPLRERRQEQHDEALRPKRQNPFALAAPAADPAEARDAQPAFSFGGVQFTGITSAESGYIPPDSIGAVGPTQIVIAANGRIKVFDKAGVLGSLNVSDVSFFNAVLGGDDSSDPHVRYDRLSGRWFISEISIPPGTNANKVVIAVSSGPTITNSSSFTFFAFQQDLVGPQPNNDTGGFADYDTLGIDRHALYIGANIFPGSGPGFLGTTGFVVNKANLLTGTLTVTAFRGLISAATGFAGVYTPQGVDNDDPASTEGYFIGVDGAVFSRLVMRRILTPGSTPSISGDLNLNVAETYYPVNQVAAGSVRTLDGLDDRLFAAMIKKNTQTGISSLWTAHNIAVNSAGAGSETGDRNGSRWYQIDNLTTFPSVTQTGTVFSNAGTNPRGYWIPSIAANGQGHAAISGSTASAVDPAGVFMNSRDVNSASGTMPSSGFVLANGGCSYNAQTGGSAAQRWGDFSQVVVDPTDNMTLWSFQELCNSTNSWGVNASKLRAPPPATPIASNTIPTGVASALLVISASTSAGSRFYDAGPDTGGPGFANHLTASITGGVVVNSVVFVDPFKVTLNVSTTGAASGLKHLTITNPDGQSITVNDFVLITSAAASTLTRAPAALNFAVTKTDAYGALLFPGLPQKVTVASTGPAPSWNVAIDVPWLQALPLSGTGAGQFEVSITNPGNVIGGRTALTGSIVIWSVTAAPVVVTVNLTVTYGAAPGAKPFGQVDTPVQNALNQQGAIGITGWALDDRAVNFVRVYRPCLAFDNPASCSVLDGHNLVFVASAAFLPGARPDVESAFPTMPLAHRAGWGLQILTNMLPHIPNSLLYGGQGTFTFYVYAFDAEGQETLLGRTYVEHTPTTVQVNNDAIEKPFGTVDTPTLGETVSGTLPIFGWSITPDTNTVADAGDILIPTNGTTMTIFVDSVATATIAYNHCRDSLGTPPVARYCTDDISNIFGSLTPQLPLSPRSSNPTRFRNLDTDRGAIGVYNLDTTALSNGFHSIAWSVRDSADRLEGIGSRFFVVLNSGVRPAQKEALLNAPAASRGAASSIASSRPSLRRISGRTGFDLAAPFAELPRGNGVRTMSMSGAGRIEIAMSSAVDAGYLVVNDQLRDLPIGSHLDRKSGIFGWAPPPGYLGTYRLVFLIGAERIDVDVTIADTASKKSLLRTIRSSR